METNKNEMSATEMAVATTPLLSSELEPTSHNHLPSRDWINLGEHVDVSYNHVFTSRTASSSSSTARQSRNLQLSCSVDINRLNPFVPSQGKTGSNDWENDYYKCFAPSSPSSTSRSHDFSDTKSDQRATSNSIPPSNKIPSRLAIEGRQIVNSTSEVSIPEGVPLTLAEANLYQSTLVENDESKPPPKKRRRTTKKEPEVKIYVDRFTEVDVLLGRGGRSNHHPGNKRYRDEVGNRQAWYLQSEKQEKTGLAEDLVAFVEGYGGRFLKKDPNNGKWYIVPPKVARRKASQALREHDTPEERAKKKEKYAKE